MHSWTMACERPPRPLHQLRLRAIALALRAKEASRHLIDVAATPPREEGNRAHQHIIVITPVLRRGVLLTLFLPRHETFMNRFDEFIRTAQAGLRVKAGIVVFGISGS